MLQIGLFQLFWVATKTKTNPFAKLCLLYFSLDYVSFLLPFFRSLKLRKKWIRLICKQRNRTCKERQKEKRQITEQNIKDPRRQRNEREGRDWKNVRARGEILPPIWLAQKVYTDVQIKFCFTILVLLLLCLSFCSVWGVYLSDKPISRPRPFRRRRICLRRRAGIDLRVRWKVPSSTRRRSGLPIWRRPARSWSGRSGEAPAGRRTRSAAAQARGCRCSGPSGTGSLRD